MYMRCTSGASGQHASLLSSEQQPVFKKCLQFSYSMHGDDVYALKVFMRTALSDYTLWRQHSNHGPYWKTATIPITSFQPFQVRSKSGHVYFASLWSRVGWLVIDQRPVVSKAFSLNGGYVKFKNHFYT